MQKVAKTVQRFEHAAKIAIARTVNNPVRIDELTHSIPPSKAVPNQYFITPEELVRIRRRIVDST